MHMLTEIIITVTCIIIIAFAWLDMSSKNEKIHLKVVIILLNAIQIIAILGTAITYGFDYLFSISTTNIFSSIGFCVFSIISLILVVINYIKPNNKC